MARKRVDQTELIHADWWDEGEQVEIRSCLSRGMKKQIEASMFSFVDTSELDLARPMETMKINMQKAIETGDEKKIEVFIVSWTLKDSAGQVLPLPTGLDDLVEEDLKFIEAEIEKRLATEITPEQRDDFLLKSGVGTSESTGSTSQHHGG